MSRATGGVANGDAERRRSRQRRRMTCRGPIAHDPPGELFPQRRLNARYTTIFARALRTWKCRASNSFSLAARNQKLGAPAKRAVALPRIGRPWEDGIVRIKELLTAHAASVNSLLPCSGVSHRVNRHTCAQCHSGSELRSVSIVRDADKTRTKYTASSWQRVGECVER